MSNKTQLQTNNTNLSNLIETLRGKASGGGGGTTSAGQWICIAESPTTRVVSTPGGSSELIVPSLEVESNTSAIVFEEFTSSGNHVGSCLVYWQIQGVNSVLTRVGDIENLTILEVVENDTKILQFTYSESLCNLYALQIYNPIN